MKNVLNIVAASLICNFFIFLVGAFANATFDLSEWSPAGRGVIATLMLFATFFLVVCGKELLRALNIYDGPAKKERSFY